MARSEAAVGKRAKTSRKVFYGWWVAAAGALSMTFISAVTWQSTGTFLVALEEDFGWSRTLLSGAFSIARAEGALMGPFEGVLADRMGSRRTLTTGLLICGVGFLLFTTVSHPVPFYFVYVVITSGAGLGGYVPIATMINHWFARNRSRAMAVVMLGGSVGGALVPLIAWGIVTHGWRWVAGGIGVFVLMLALPVAMLVRDRPERMGLRPDGDSEAPKTDTSVMAVSSAPEMTAREAMRTWAFWGIALSHAGTGIMVTTLALHLVPHLHDQGMSLPLAGMVVLVMTSVAACFQVVGGWLGDRVDKRYVIFGFMIMQGLAVLFLLMVDSLMMAMVFAVLQGAAHGGRAPAATTIRGEYFGRKSFGTILGISMIPMNAGSVAMPLLAGLMYDLRGSYTIPFLAMGVMVLVCGALILTVRPPRGEAKRDPLAVT
ncbi:MAG: MFS transporter [SAR202 cluster bacterium]|nr:MFS transporter [SAR202 cluster bacterium]